MDFTLARFANCVQAGGLALALIAMELVAGCASTDGDGRTTYLTRRPESVGVKSSCCLTLSQIREVGSLRSYQEITLAPTTEHYKFNQSLSPTLVFSLPADFQGRTLELLAEDSMRSMVLARVGVFPAPVAIFIDDADRLMAAPTDSGEYSRNNSLDLAYPQRIGRAYTIPIGARKVAITVDASLAGQKTKAADFNSENGEPTSNREPKDFLNAVYGNIEVLVHSDVQVARGSQSLAAKDTTLRLYVESGQAEPAQTSYALAALSDSKRLLAVGSHSEVVVWNLSAKREILRFPINQYTHTIAFSHDERLLVVGGNESQVWNLALRKRVSPLQTVYLAAISSDSHQILTSYADGASNESAWLWEYGEDQTVPTRRRGKAFPTICGLYFDDNEPRVIHFSESRPWDRKKTYRVVISDIEGHTIADLDNWPGSGIFTSCIYHSKAGILVA